MNTRKIFLCLICAVLVALVSFAWGEQTKPLGTASRSYIETQEKVLQIIAEVLDIEASRIDPKKQLTDPSIGADDLDVVEIVVEVETVFRIRIPEERYTDRKTNNVDLTVEKLVEIVESIRQETKGPFGGLGIEITVKDGILTVVSPIEGTPAYTAGVLAGDQIIKIDGEPTKNLTLVDCVKRLRGPRGTKVTITIMREGLTEPKDFTLVRDVIKQKEK